MREAVQEYGLPQLCVRVSVKVGPIDTKIGIPNELFRWVKTTLIQRRGSSTWEFIEDRAGCDLITEFAREDDVRRALSFLQPPRKTEDAVCFVASLREVDLSLE